MISKWHSDTRQPGQFQAIVDRRYPVVKSYYHRTARKKGPQIARTLVTKELAKSVYFVLKNNEPYNNLFKGMKLEKTKTMGDRLSPYVASQGKPGRITGSQ